MAISKIENASLASGVPSTAKLPAGTVLQVVNAVSNSTASGSGSNVAVTAITASITPSSASSKILIIARMPYNLTRSSATAGWCSIKVLRNGNAISPNPGVNFEAGLNWGSSGSSDLRNVLFIQSLDSPASTSSVTYSIQGVNYDSQTTLTVNESGWFYTSITLMEIAA